MPSSSKSSSSKPWPAAVDGEARAAKLSRFRTKRVARLRLALEQSAAKLKQRKARQAAKKAKAEAALEKAHTGPAAEAAAAVASAVDEQGGEGGDADAEPPIKGNEEEEGKQEEVKAGGDVDGTSGKAAEGAKGEEQAEEDGPKPMETEASALN